LTIILTLAYVKGFIERKPTETTTVFQFWVKELRKGSREMCETGKKWVLI